MIEQLFEASVLDFSQHAKTSQERQFGLISKLETEYYSLRVKGH